MLCFFFLDCDPCLLGIGRHEANAVGASSKSPLQIGVPHSQLLWLLLLRVYSFPQGTWAPSWQQRLQAANKWIWKAGPLAFRRTSSMVHFIFPSSPWDQAEARLQLRLHPCLDFFSCSVRPPLLLFSWEQPQSITFTKMPTKALGVWKRTQNTWLNTSKWQWWASTVTFSLTPVHLYYSLARG